MADDTPARRLPFSGVVNFRDLGGYPTSSGHTTRYRMVFRSDALHRLTDEDLALYGSLGIKAVYDLRSTGERELHPNPVPSRQIALESRVPREEFEDGSILANAGDARERLLEVYLLMLRTGADLFGELLRELAVPEQLPAVFHCAGGKDRTGLAAALLLSAVGVDRETILDDYVLTGTSMTVERHAEVLERFVALGMSPEAAYAFLEAPRDLLAAALNSLDTDHGGVDGYLRRECGLDDRVFEALRGALLE